MAWTGRDFGEMFAMEVDMRAGYDDNDEYPGVNRIEMMANPALWMTETHWSDVQMITLRQICMNNIAYGGARESCGVDEITEDLRKTTGNMNISLQTAISLLCQIKTIVFRRAVKSKHLRVYAIEDGPVAAKVKRFQKDRDSGRVPDTLPSVVLKAVWSAPPAEPLVPMKYRRNAGYGINYDAGPKNIKDSQRVY